MELILPETLDAASVAALTAALARPPSPALPPQAGGGRLVVLRGAGPAFCRGLDPGCDATRSVDTASPLSRRAVVRYATALSPPSPGGGGEDAHWASKLPSGLPPPGGSLLIARRPDEGKRNRLPTWDAAEATGAFAELLLALRGAPVPTIALVDGAALGGGLGLAAACDIVIATTRARFGLPEALCGLVPAMVMPVIHERVLPAAARRLALGALAVDAAEALTLGLVDVVTDDLPRALRHHARVLSRAAPASVAWIKTPPPELVAAVRAGAITTAERLADPTVLAALAAIAAGEPGWEGRW